MRDCLHTELLKTNTDYPNHYTCRNCGLGFHAERLT